MSRSLIVAAVTVAFAAGFVVHDAMPTAHAQTGSRVYELRTYTANEGKLDALHARFRDHTLRLFEKHGMENVVYFAPSDAPLAENTLVYLVAHDSREAATASWAAFGTDPEWIAARDASQVDGALVAGVESVFLTTTDYSPLR
jgi:hypothetical protein